MRAVGAHEPCTPITQVDPGGELLLSVRGWPKVNQVFRLIDSGLMAYASAYGLVLVTVILLPIIIAARVFRIDVFAVR